MRDCVLRRVDDRHGTHRWRYILQAERRQVQHVAVHDRGARGIMRRHATGAGGLQAHGSFFDARMRHVPRKGLLRVPCHRMQMLVRRFVLQVPMVVTTRPQLQHILASALQDHCQDGAIRIPRYEADLVLA